MKADVRLFVFTQAQVAFRGALYILASALPELVSALSSSEPVNWRLVWAKMALAAVIALRAYLDRSPAQTEPEKANDPDTTHTETPSLSTPILGMKD